MISSHEIFRFIKQNIRMLYCPFFFLFMINGSFIFISVFFIFFFFTFCFLYLFLSFFFFFFLLQVMRTLPQVLYQLYRYLVVSVEYQQIHKKKLVHLMHYLQIYTVVIKCFFHDNLHNFIQNSQCQCSAVSKEKKN